MADCRYCGKPAGLLRRKHDECESRHEVGSARISSLLVEKALSSDPLFPVLGEIQELSKAAFLTDNERRSTLLLAWNFIVGTLLDSRNPDDAAVKRIAEFRETFMLSRAEVLDAPSVTLQVRKLIATAAEEYGSLDKLLEHLRSIAGDEALGSDDGKSILLGGWRDAVNALLKDGVMDALEEARIVKLKTSLALSDTEVDRDGTWTRVVKAGAIREVLHGELPQRMHVEGLSINLQKTETVVWVFHNTQYWEDKTRREYVGRSHGVSVRIAKGLYYRTSSFKGHPIDRTERAYVDTGALVLTNKNIYFAGPAKSFRVPYPKVVTFQPYTDGIGIIRDAASAKPQTFITGDGWFTYNMTVNLAQL